MRFWVTLAPGEERAIELFERPNGRTEVRLDGEIYEVELIEAGGALSVRIHGAESTRVLELWLDEAASANGEALGFVGGGERRRATVETERTRLGRVSSAGRGPTGGAVRAPMPGRVVKVLVAQGDEVAAGAPVAVVEAMKMENELCADVPGVVAKICVDAGQNVEAGATLVELT